MSGEDISKNLSLGNCRKEHTKGLGGKAQLQNI
jgi:hypothetical protein